MLTSGTTSGRYPGLGLKAWVLLNGTTGAIVRTFGISGIVRNSVGNYTMTFAAAAANTNYMINFEATGQLGNLDKPGNVLNAAKLTGSFQIVTTQAGSATDAQQLFVEVYE